MSSKYALVLAMVLGVLAAFAFQQHLRSLEEESQKKIEPVRVVFARETIPAGVQLREDVLEARDFPSKSLFDQLVTWDQMGEKLIGKVAARSIPAGQPVLLDFVEVKMPAPASGISLGRRAFTLSTDAISAVSGMIKTGSRVDIIAHLHDAEGGAGRPRQAGGGGAQASTTVTVLENIEVLGIGQQGGARHWGSAAGGDLSSVTVSVTPQEAELLAHVQKEGALTLSLRREGDREATRPEVIDSRNLLQSIERIRDHAGAPSGR